MSIKIMTLVWEQFKSGGSEKLTMLALADWCDDTGGNLYPSIAGVARKINTSDCQARRIIHKLIDDGYLEVVGNYHGGGSTCSRRYKINISRLAPSVDATPSIDVTPSTHARHPSHPCTLPLAPVRAEPSLTINKATANKTYGEEFEIFWQAYPKKTGKTDAHKSWLKNKPPIDLILKALAWQSRTEQWLKDNGQFVPNPATYLNQGRWQDEPTIIANGSRITPTVQESKLDCINQIMGTRYGNDRQVVDITPRGSNASNGASISKVDAEVWEPVSGKVARLKHDGRL